MCSARHHETRRPRRAAALRLLLVLLLGGAAAWGCWILASRVVGPPHALDRRLLLALREPGAPGDPLGPWWVEEAVRDLTALGSTTVLAAAVLLALLLLALQRQWRRALLLLLAVLGARLLTSGLKLLIDRPRPELVPRRVPLESASFPSGHALLAAAVFLMLALLAAQRLSTRRLRVALIASAALLAALVACSRVYLGLHWPSDALAGWTLGVGWAGLFCLLLRRFAPVSDAPHLRVRPQKPPLE